eukprot:4992840-Pyramimonas_sp.AAC.1
MVMTMVMMMVMMMGLTQEHWLEPSRCRVTAGAPSGQGHGPWPLWQWRSGPGSCRSWAQPVFHMPMRARWATWTT